MGLRPAGCIPLKAAEITKHNIFLFVFKKLLAYIPAKQQNSGITKKNMLSQANQFNNIKFNDFTLRVNNGDM